MSIQGLLSNSQFVVLSSRERIGGSYFVDPSFCIPNTISELSAELSLERKNYKFKPMNGFSDVN